MSVILGGNFPTGVYLVCGVHLEACMCLRGQEMVARIRPPDVA
jgi:hypothetical protein